MSEGLNKCALIGYVGAEPELRHTPGGSAVLGFRVAATTGYVDKDGQRQEATYWQDVSVWGKRAEALARIIRKGTRLYVEGPLKSRTWEKTDGSKGYGVDLNVRELVLLDGKRDGVATRADAGGHVTSAGASAAQVPLDSYKPADVDDMDDLPF